MKLRTMLGSTAVAVALLLPFGATAANAAYQTGHHISGPTKAACQTSLNNAYNTFSYQRKTITKVIECRATVRADGSRSWSGAIFVRN